MLNAAKIARSAPLTKLAMWVGATALVALLAQAVATLTGLGFSLLDKQGGAAAVILIALGALLAMMAVESRPLADYGLIADANWRRRGLTGLAIGAGCYAAYCLFAGWRGLFFADLDAASASRWVKAMLAGLAATPLAATQQILFSGYLLTTLRDRHSRAVAVGIPAVLFALAAAAAAPGGLAGPDGRRLFVGMLLLQTLLGLLRLRTGSIVLPAGVLAGGILVRKLLIKSRVLGVEWNHPDSWWLAPSGDPRQGWLMWGILGCAIVGVALALTRRGERRLEADAEIDASFKRYLPFSNLLGLAPLDRWAALLWQSRMRIGAWYVPRLVVSLIGSALGTLLALPERLLAPLLVRHDVPPPVFIVGMPRSGTTHLHNLLALDPQFRSTRNCEAFNPHGFLTGWLTTACLTPLMTWRRPMDAVQMTVFSTQEEEFALAAMGSPSPYWSFCFPREIDRHDRYWLASGFSDAERRRWGRHYRLLLRKLTFWRRRTPLLKNPANTGRVAMLKRLFPGAKFVHIVRHPHAVWRSNQRLAEHGLAVFQLQDPRPEDNYATRSLANYRRVIDAFYADAAGLAPGDVAELRFEDLEASPAEAIRGVFDQLGLTPSDGFEARLKAYLEGVRGYRKNRFADLPAADREAIDRVMAPYLAMWGYTEDVACRAA